MRQILSNFLNSRAETARQCSSPVYYPSVSVSLENRGLVMVTELIGSNLSAAIN